MNPFVSIWTQPRKTIEYVLEYKSWSYGFFIILLASVSTGLTVFSDSGMAEDFPLFFILLGGILATLLGGVIGWFINAGLYTWVGKWLKGTGNFKDMATITPLGSIPLIWMFPINVLLVAMYGQDLFRDPLETMSISMMPAALFWLINLLTFGLGIYSTVILSKAIGIVHHFSAWRGFGTIMIIVGIVLAILIPIFILIFFVLFAAAI